jgi:hypothetical protein
MRPLCGTLGNGRPSGLRDVGADMVTAVNPVLLALTRNQRITTGSVQEDLNVPQGDSGKGKSALVSIDQIGGL